MLEIKRLCALLVATQLVGFGGLAEAKMQSLPTVKLPDVQSFIGKWHEIALINNCFQRTCVRDTEAKYAVREAGELLLRYRCVTVDGLVEVAIGAARRVTPDDSTRLQLRFAPAWLAWLPVVWGDYRVMGLADDSRYAVVGELGRGFLRILARGTGLSNTDQIAIEGLLRSVGYDPQRLVKTPLSSGMR